MGLYTERHGGVKGRQCLAKFAVIKGYCTNWSIGKKQQEQGK